MDLVLQAHVHDYERTWPVAKGKAVALNYSDAPAPVYIVNGAAGNREANARPSGDEPWQPPAGPPGKQPYSSEVSIGVMTVTTGGIKWEQLRSSNGTVIDTFEMTKK